MTNVNVVNTGAFELPKYAHPGDAGMDLKANIEEPITIAPGDNALISTGIHTNLPEGVYANIKGRSGLAARCIICAEGVVDIGYLGDWKVNLINLGKEPFVVNPGDRIAQVVFTRFVEVAWTPVEKLEDTVRGTNGFGSSGV